MELIRSSINNPSKFFSAINSKLRTEAVARIAQLRGSSFITEGTVDQNDNAALMMTPGAASSLATTVDRHPAAGTNNDSTEAHTERGKSKLSTFHSVMAK